MTAAVVPMVPRQRELLEPTGAEILPMAERQAALADQYRRRADACRARGWEALERQALVIAQLHAHEAECLAMLADLERLAEL